MLFYFKNGGISSLPYLCQALVSIIASYITDKVREKGVISATNLRKINNSFGNTLNTFEIKTNLL